MSTLRSTKFIMYEKLSIPAGDKKKTRNRIIGLSSPPNLFHIQFIRITIHVLRLKIFEINWMVVPKGNNDAPSYSCSCNNHLI